MIWVAHQTAAPRIVHRIATLPIVTPRLAVVQIAIAAARIATAEDHPATAVPGRQRPIRSIRFSKLRLIFVAVSLIIIYPSFFFTDSFSEFNTLQAGFYKYSCLLDTTPVLSGTFYYQHQKSLIIRVREPVNQWFIIYDKQCLLYYPDDHRAFQFTSDQILALPLVEMFIRAAAPDFGLSTLNYNLTESEKKGDTINMVWSARSNARAMRCRVTFIGRKLIIATWENAEGKALTRMQFFDHQAYKRAYLPMTVINEYCGDDDTLREKIIYTDLRIDQFIPDSITEFMIPPDARVDTIQW